MTTVGFFFCRFGGEVETASEEGASRVSEAEAGSGWGRAVFLGDCEDAEDDDDDDDEEGEEDDAGEEGDASVALSLFFFSVLKRPASICEVTLAFSGQHSTTAFVDFLVTASVESLSASFLSLSSLSCSCRLMTRAMCCVYISHCTLYLTTVVTSPPKRCEMAKRCSFGKGSGCMLQ